MKISEVGPRSSTHEHSVVLYFEVYCFASCTVRICWFAGAAANQGAHFTCVLILDCFV